MRAGGRARYHCFNCDGGVWPESVRHPRQHGAADRSNRRAAAAIAVATDLIVGQRHSVDLGLMQVNSANLAALGLSIADAFDACRSVEAGGRVLSEAYQRALRGALSVYNTGDLATWHCERIRQPCRAHGPLGSADRSRRFCAFRTAAIAVPETRSGWLGRFRPERWHTIRLHRQVRE